MSLPPEEVERLLHGTHPHPFSILGPQVETEDEMRVRCFKPGAVTLELIPREGTPLGMERIHEAGLFEGRLPSSGPYRIRWHDTSGKIEEVWDPYAFPGWLKPGDLVLGRPLRGDAHRRLGAHPLGLSGVAGVGFAVWAPNALGVALVGDFNAWEPRGHPMERHDGSGIWQLFVPGLEVGCPYQFHLETTRGPLRKSDPFAFLFETPPATASRVLLLGRHDWQDREWMESRPARHTAQAPAAVYEVHLGSWRHKSEEGPSLSYRELARELVDYVREMGFTHVELLPVSEHGWYPSWGYQTNGYFAPTSRFGGPQEFQVLVEACHRAGLALILDWVPAHFPRDSHTLARFDGTPLYEYADPRRSPHPEWGTHLFNYERPEVCEFLLSSALFWLEEYHVDGLRVDAVSSMLYRDYSRPPGQWVANPQGGNENLEAAEFLRQLNRALHERFPGVVTAAEESSFWPGVTRTTEEGGLGFDWKWNLGWTREVLSYFSRPRRERTAALENLAQTLGWAFGERFILPLSHDEVISRRGSLLAQMAGHGSEQLADLRLLVLFQYAHPGKKLLFMGAELGQPSPWDVNRSLEWEILTKPDHRQLQDFVRQLNRLYRAHPALYERDFDPGGLEWSLPYQPGCAGLAFVRRGERERLLCVFNFSARPEEFLLPVPHEGRYRELISSDWSCFGGTADVGGEYSAVPAPGRSHPWQLSLRLAPSSGLFLVEQERGEFE